MKILYDDPEFVVFEKSAGTDSEKITWEEVFGKGAEGTLFCVHRLDKGVGGVTVYAKTEKTAAVLSAGFADRTIRKTYLAVTEGVPDPMSGEMEDLLFHDRRTNKTFVTDRERKGVKRASLQYEVLAAGPALERKPAALVRIRLNTGRTHQIRVQFASRKLPLAGDRRYGAKTAWAGGIALWSHELQMPHPVTGERLHFVSDFGAAEEIAAELCKVNKNASW